MMLSVLDVVNDVLSRSGQSPLASVSNQSSPGRQVLSFLNSVYAEMLQTLDIHDLLQSLVLDLEAGTPDYAIESPYEPESLVGDSVIHEGERQPLSEMGPDHAAKLDMSQTGRPNFFWLKGNKLFVWPVPDKAYTLHLDFYPSPDRLTTDTQTLAIPAPWQRVLVAGTQAHLEFYLGLPTAENTYSFYVQGMAQLRHKRSSHKHLRMKGPGWMA